MLHQIDRTQRKMQKRYLESRRHTIQVDFYAYLDELDRESRRGRRRARQNLSDEVVRKEAA